MTGPGKQYEYNKGMRIVNWFADRAITCLKPLTWTIRSIKKIWPSKWHRSERRTESKPVK